MAASARLSTEEREFFALITKAIFTNPFSDERAEAAALIAPERRPPGRRRHPMDHLIPALNERIGRLEQRGLGSVQSFQGEDRRLVRYAFLYQIYLQFVEELNELIQIQSDKTDTPIPFRSADRMIALLKGRGFTNKEALRYLALGYQLRRGFHFIDRSLVGRSPCMKRLRLALWNNVFTHDVPTYDRYLWNRMEDFSTLLLGETGTGKGAAAAAIGCSGYIPFDRREGCFSESFAQTFVTMNLSQFPESLIESELFGHRKGAFTGAVDHHKGLFERCSPHGALFLDEIGDVGIPVQIKLLRVLQDRRFNPVGSHAEVRFTGRVIAATNRSLDQLRRQGRFRDDFFYRLCSDVITVPPLRQRLEEDPGELAQMVDLLVDRTTGEESPDLTDMILETLKRDLPGAYPWRGNVRELEQAVRRIILTRRYDGDLTTVEASPAETLWQSMQDGTLEARALLSRYCALLYERLGSYEEVARRTRLDRRTVKRYVEANFSAESERC